MLPITNTESIIETFDRTFNFEVDKFPMMGPDNMATPCYGLFRSDTGEFIGGAKNSVSKDYEPHTRDDVKVMVEAAQTVFTGDHKIQCHWRDGHYVNVMPTDNHRRSVFGTKDNIFPRLIVRAGYDGKSYSGTLGMYRDACMNLIMLRLVKGITISLRHNSRLREKMDELIDDFSQLGEGWEAVNDHIDAMENRDVAMATFLDNIYPQPGDGAAGREITIHANRTKAIIQRLQRERAKIGRTNPHLVETVTGWEAYNAIQGYVQHDATRSNKAQTWDRIILASNDKAVHKAEKLALAI